MRKNLFMCEKQKCRSAGLRRRLINTFVLCCLHNIIYLLIKYKKFSHPLYCSRLVCVRLGKKHKDRFFQDWVIWFFRIQAGKYHEALELLKTALKIEEKELGARRHRMVELYALMAEIYDEVS